MMLGSATAQLLFTCVFAAAALGAALTLARAVRRLRPAHWASGGFCIGMCGALLAMTWWAEPAGVVWLQAAVFGGAALWLVLTGPLRAGLRYVLMAAAMTWMLTVMPARSQMPGMIAAAPSVPELFISGLVAA